MSTSAPFFDGAIDSFTRLTRLTIQLESVKDRLTINNNNPVFSSYDLIAVEPMNEKAFQYACNNMEVDIITLDCSQRLDFYLKNTTCNIALQRGIHFEICYSPSIIGKKKKADGGNGDVIVHTLAVMIRCYFKEISDFKRYKSYPCHAWKEYHHFIKCFQCPLSPVSPRRHESVMRKKTHSRMINNLSPLKTIYQRLLLFLAHLYLVLAKDRLMSVSQKTLEKFCITLLLGDRRTRDWFQWRKLALVVVVICQLPLLNESKMKISVAKLV